MRTSRQEDTSRLLRDDLEQIRDDQDLRKLLTVLLTSGPDALRLLCDLVALTKQAKKDPELMPFFTSLLTLGSELHEYKKKVVDNYRDVRMLEKRHSAGGLSVQDLALLECRHVLGRSAFLELVAKDAFQWLDGLPLSAFCRAEEDMPRGGAPLSPRTISAWVKLHYLIPPEDIISDETDDALTEYRSGHEKRVHRRSAYQRAAKRVERILKRAGFATVCEFSKLIDLLSLKEFWSAEKFQRRNDNGSPRSKDS